MTNLLLLLFALPIATIILASVFETILHCPIKVAAIFFAIYLVVTFAFFDANFLIFAILYTILAFISAIITRLISRIIRDNNCNNTTNCATVNTVNTTVNTQNLDNNSSCGCNTRYRRY